MLRRESTEGALLSVLKGLEIQKTLGTEPVLTALRHFPARPAQMALFRLFRYPADPAPSAVPTSK